MRKLIVLLCGAFFLSACAGDSSTTVRTMQRKDKQLSCREVLLEMNEAEFHKKTAEKNQGPKLKNVLMPLGYISTYMNAEEAIGAANARVSYLDKIYEIMACESNEGGGQQAANPYNQVRSYPPIQQGYMAAPAFVDGYAPIRGRLEQRTQERGLY